MKRSRIEGEIGGAYSYMKESLYLTLKILVD